MRQRGAQQAAVSVAHAFETRLKAVVDAGEPAVPGMFHFAGLVLIAAGFTAQQVLDHGGDQGAREEVRGHDGEHHGQRQGREQVARRAAEEDDRHDADT